MNKIYLLQLAVLGCALSAQAQTSHRRSALPKAECYVSGIVTDASTHQPVQGVQVSSGQYEALTDEKGHYRVGASSRHANITLRRDGYTERVVALRGDTLVNTTLYSQAFRPKLSNDAFTTATTAISLEDLLAERAGSDVRKVSRSGAAGVGANLFIRGYNSLNANAQPLIVVDGVIWDEQTQVSSLFEGQYNNPLSDIDVNDIEQVQILKNASSIYGTKGANGAILITTKRSHSRVTKITADLSYGFNLRPKTYDMLNAADYRTYLSEVMKGTSTGSSYATLFKSFMGTDPTATDYSTYHNNTDWSDEVYRMGGTQHYGVSIDGSDDVASYAISLGFTQSNGTVKSTDYSRLNARINADFNLSRKLQLGTRMYYTYVAKDLQDDGVEATTSPTYISCIKSPFLVPYSYTDDGSMLTNTLNDVDVLGISNPVALIENAKNTNKHYRFGISLMPSWKINSHFTLDGVAGYTLISTKEHYFSPMTGVAAKKVDGHTWRNTVKDQAMTQNNLYGNVNLKYNLLKGKSALDAMVGYRIMHAQLKNTYADGHNTGNDKVTNLNNSLSYRTLSGVDTDWGSMSLMAQVDYTYDHRYQAWATLSEDASSRFGKDASGSFRMMGGSWATFPSAGAAWNISNERFMNSLKWIDKARVYVGYGLTGNDDMDGMSRYSYLSGVKYLGNATGLKIGALANDQLKWETVSKLNAGLQLSLLDDRLQLGFDYYRHVTSDLLTYKKADVETGLDYYMCNGGKMKNTGYEVSVGARPIALKNFSWQTDLSFSHYKNQITQLPDGEYTTQVGEGEVLTSVGGAAGLFYGYKTEGIFATSEEAKAANLKVQNSDASYSHFGAGDVHFVDRDGNGIINEADKQVIGDPNPDLTGSFFNRFTYKRITLDVLCTYSLGNDIYNYQRQTLESMSSFYNQTNAVRNRWKNEGQNATMPRAVYGDPMGNSRFSDRWIEDGSFFAIKNVKISYDIPISNTYIHGLNVWLAASNLYTFTHYLGVNPDVSQSSNVLYQGIDYGYLAEGRSFYVGVKINL